MLGLLSYYRELAILLSSRYLNADEYSSRGEWLLGRCQKVGSLNLPIN